MEQRALHEQCKYVLSCVRDVMEPIAPLHNVVRLLWGCGQEMVSSD